MPQPAVLARLAAPPGPAVAVAMPLLAFALAAAMHMPGHIPYDALWQWADARTALRSSPYERGMTLAWWLLERVAPGPVPFTLLQLGTLYAAAAGLARGLGLPLGVAACFYAWLLLWPPVFALQGQLMRDMLGGNLLLAAFALLSSRPARPRLAAAGAFALCAWAASIRIQYAIGFPGLGALALAWLPPGERPAWRPLLADVGVALGVATALLALSTAVLARSDYHSPVQDIGRKVVLFDLAGTVANRPGPAPTLPGVDAAELETRIRRLYSPERVDTLWVEGGVFDLVADVPDAALLQALGRVAIDAPEAFLRHRLAAFRAFLALGTPTTCWPVFAGVAVPRRGPPAIFTVAKGVGHAASFTVLRAGWFPAGTVVFRPWPYVLLHLLVLAGWLARSRWRRAMPAAVPALSGTLLLYEASFLAVPQACDFRYSYLAVVGAGVAVAGLGAAWLAPRLPRSVPLPTT